MDTCFFAWQICVSFLTMFCFTAMLDKLHFTHDLGQNDCFGIFY